MKRFTVFKNYIQGFTLMELMVVIVIMGIMASFAIPRYQKTVEKSHRGDAEAQLIVLHGANNIFRAQSGNFLVGANLDAAAINTGLGLNLIENGMTFSYTSALPNYASTATRDTSGFVITITDAPISGTNPACTTGPCP